MQYHDQEADLYIDYQGVVLQSHVDQGVVFQEKKNKDNLHYISYTWVIEI